MERILWLEEAVEIFNNIEKEIRKFLSRLNEGVAGSITQETE